MIRRYGLLAVALLLLALAGGQDRASAAPPPAGGWGAAAIRLADDYWGGPPTLCTSLHWSFDVVLPPDRAGQATMPTAPTPCEAEIGPQTSAYELCIIVVHEDGHLHGLDHSTDPTNIMFGAPYSDTAAWQPDLWQCHAFAHEMASVTNITHKPRRVR